MKIDEVIEHFENCISYNGDCSECKMGTVCLSFPYRDFDKETLRYLKEYRDFQNNIKCENCEYWCKDLKYFGEIYCSNMNIWTLKDDWCCKFVERMS